MKPGFFCLGPHKALLFILALIPLLPLAFWLIEGRNQQILHFQPVSGPISNPLMGWAPWATITQSKQPFTLVYVDLTWREFEPQPGIYDFAAFEQKQQFGHWRAENKRVVFRFICDRPGPEYHLDIPDWLYQATDGGGDRYSNEYGKGFSPDYSNQVFIKYHQAAIQALGARYGKDPFFAYIELGSLGNWGEWHVHADSGIRPLPSQDIRDEYVRQYIAAFPDTFLLMRRPFQIAKQMNLGLYNDMTGDPEGTHQWLNWIKNGGDYEQTGEKNALSAMPTAWQTAPIGGEETVGLSHKAMFASHIDQTLQLLEQSHMTFIGPNSPYDVDPQSPLQPGIDRVMERIGYRIYVNQVQMPFWMLSGLSLRMPVTITFSNDGVAPIYYKWSGHFYILDESGNIRKAYQPNMDVRKILPGEPYRLTIAMPINGLKKGSYTLGFAITDPVSSKPAVRLAMDNSRSDEIQELGSFDIVGLWEFLSW